MGPSATTPLEARPHEGAQQWRADVHGASQWSLVGLEDEEEVVHSSRAPYNRCRQHLKLKQAHIMAEKIQIKEKISG